MKAKVIREQGGAYRILCQRARRKWWFELGRHGKTDTEFEKALQNNSVEWLPKIYDESKIL